MAAEILERWGELLATSAFVKVMPHDYKRVLREQAEQEALAASASGNGAAPTSPATLAPLDAVGGAGS